MLNIEFGNKRFQDGASLLFFALYLMETEELDPEDIVKDDICFGPLLGTIECVPYDGGTCNPPQMLGKAPAKAVARAPRPPPPDGGPLPPPPPPPPPGRITI